jgi:SAM-dependent methyltransferase
MSLSYELAACPACASGVAAEVASRDAIRLEIEALWRFHLRRLLPTTPPEHLTDRLAFTQSPPLRLARCSTCGTLRRDPQERAPSVLTRYAEEPLSPAVLRALSAAQKETAARQRQRLSRLAGPTGTGLEVGCYVGSFLAATRDSGWHFHGIDVNPSAVSFVRALGLSAEEATLEHLPSSPRYDAVVLWNCFEQLPRSATTLRLARELLRPTGILALRVPNGAFYHRWRAFLHGTAHPLATALLAHNNLLGFPYRYGFTPASLSRMLQRLGFTVIATHAEVLVPTADRWTRRWAAWEERALQAVLRRFRRASAAPWFEVYARPTAARA